MHILSDGCRNASLVAQLSGHKNLKSLDSYKSASIEQQRKMSLVLSRSTENTNEAVNTERTVDLSTSTARSVQEDNLLPIGL